MSVEHNGHRWEAPIPSVAVVKPRRSEKAVESKLIEMERCGVSTQELRKWIGKAKQAVQERVREREAIDRCMAASYLSSEGALKLLDLCEPTIPSDVAEVWSPPRVTAKAVARGLVPGPAIDILQGYDLPSVGGRTKAWRTLKAVPPNVLIPPPHVVCFQLP